MFGKKSGKARAAIVAGMISLSLAGCGANPAQAVSQLAQAATGSGVQTSVVAQTNANKDDGKTTTIVASTTSSADGALDTSDLFTDRDLEQTADLSNATSITLKSGEDVSIANEGTYVLSGTVTNVTVTVDVDSSEKVQLVLDGVQITNDDSPTIHVVSADKVFVTTAKGTTNALGVTGPFAADGSINVDAAIFSKDDLVLNGLGTLKISSTGNGVSCKDDLKVTGGAYVIECQADALEANDNVLVADGTFEITTGKDAIHAENDEDASTGNVYIAGGTFDVTAASDGIQATCVAQVDGGTLAISAAEGIEGTYVQVNGGALDISATDDGINATYKSSAMSPTLEICGGELSITMAAGDTDALDSNGSLHISGGTIAISAQSAFDYDGTGELTGGTLTVNGEQVTTLQNSMMGGGMGGQGGMGGRMGGGFGGNMGTRMLG